MTEVTGFDDRIDTRTNLKLSEIFVLLSRALALLLNVRALFVTKIIFASISLLPALAAPWFLKIVVDQVILKQPFNTNEVPFPPFIMPFVDSLQNHHEEALEPA